jgi:hypothetical protein
MTSEPTHATTATPAERRPAVWPWLLIPLVTLIIFFALRTAKEAPPQATHHADAPEATPASEDAESR